MMLFRQHRGITWGAEACPQPAFQAAKPAESLQARIGRPTKAVTVREERHSSDFGSTALSGGLRQTGPFWVVEFDILHFG